MTLVYMDIKIGGNSSGRMIFRLFDSIAPITALNFKCLCTGEKGIGRTTNKLLTYENSIFHRVIAGFMCQAGDFTKQNGSGGESIYGSKFKDESFRVKHSKRGLLSMANSGPNTNGSQFFITFGSTPHLDNKHVVFGELVEGSEVLTQIEKVTVGDRDKPVYGQEVQIYKCGVIGEKVNNDIKTAGEEEMMLSLSVDKATDKRHKKEKKDKNHKKKSLKTKSKKNKKSYRDSIDDDSSSSSDDEVGAKDNANANVIPTEHPIDVTTSNNLSEKENNIIDVPVKTAPIRLDADGLVCKGRGIMKYRGETTGRGINSTYYEKNNISHINSDNRQLRRKYDSSSTNTNGNNNNERKRQRYVPKERDYSDHRQISRYGSNNNEKGIKNDDNEYEQKTSSRRHMRSNDRNSYDSSEDIKQRRSKHSSLPSDDSNTESDKDSQQERNH